MIGVEPSSLVKDHSAENLDKEIRPALRHAGALFLRTIAARRDPHVLYPGLLASAANPR